MSGIAIGANNYAFTYDVCGNLLTENVNRRFSWDAGDRLLFFKNQVGSSQPTVETQYLYDAAGKRVKKITRKAGGLWEIRVYIDGLFEYYTDEVDVQNTVHIMDDKSRVATVRIGAAMGDTTPALKYELENNVMSSMVLLDSSGAVVNSQEYYPFGETSFGSYGKKRYQYVGKERDEESGLYYYGARYYAAWMCRFISVDPLAADYPHLTPYNYAGNKPIGDFDIDGMQGTGEQKPNTSGGNGTTTGSNTGTPPTLSAAGTTGVTATYSPPAPQAPSVLDECSGKCQTVRGPVIGGGGYTVDIPSDATTLTGKQLYPIAGKPDNKVDVTLAFSITDDKGATKMFQWSTDFNAFYSSQSNEIYGGKGVAAANGYMSSTMLGPLPIGALWNSGGSQNHPSFGTGQNVYTAQSIAAGFVPMNFGINLGTKAVTAEGAVWAQSTFSRTFSAEGKFAGQTIDEVAAQLKSGALSPKDVPIDVIVRDGQTFLLNTRSSVALTEAGIPRSAWNVVNRTGVASFEGMLSGQLNRNGLVEGLRIIRQSGTQRTYSH